MHYWDAGWPKCKYLFGRMCTFYGILLHLIWKKLYTKSKNYSDLLINGSQEFEKNLMTTFFLNFNAEIHNRNLPNVLFLSICWVWERERGAKLFDTFGSYIFLKKDKLFYMLQPFSTDNTLLITRCAVAIFMEDVPTSYIS